MVISMPQSRFFDSKKGRRIIWGWTNETDSSSDDVAKGWAGIHAIPRTIWLDIHGKQLLQWPVEEVESLRGNEINHQGLELKKGGLFEIKGADSFQADVEIDFELTSIDKADPFDPSWLLDVEKHCREAGASVNGGIGPFGLVVLASDNMEEHTAVHFRVYKSEQKYMILMCSDLRSSSLRAGLYTPAYGGFFEYDLEKEKKISLRTLIDRSAVESFGGGGRVCIMARVYPVAVVDGVAHMYAFNNGSTTVRVPQLRAWSMRRAQIYVASDIEHNIDSVSLALKELYEIYESDHTTNLVAAEKEVDNQVLVSENGTSSNTLMPISTQFRTFMKAIAKKVSKSDLVAYLDEAALTDHS
ncbi:Beta-fructofuranosidase, insoluble isoenzyme 4 [Hordeum vulgare]|nr:Beta-fructofuranosidase, insoluble isoenzyme 4 [Hordeum vulgare]